MIIMTENIATLAQNEEEETKEEPNDEMEVLFYSLFDIIHEEGKSSPLFFHVNSDQAVENEIKDVIEFADTTIDEATKLTKVRNYYFKSESTEVVSQIKDALHMLIGSDTYTESDIISKLKVISERYSDVEHRVIQKSNVNKPSPSNLFYVLSQTSSNDQTNNFIFFIAKIEKSEFLHSGNDAFKLLKGLPHRTDGKKSEKNWKTATIHISAQSVDEEISNLEVDKVVISDTNSRISTYWYSSFLETTEVTDDEKNTLEAYKEIRRMITSLNREKDRTANRQADVNHFINQLNGYFLNSEEFNYEDMVTSVFGTSYTPVCSTLNMANVHTKVENALKDATKFDNNFSIIKSVVKDKVKQTYKVSDKIEIRINKHVDGIRDIISSEKDELGNPYIKIKVESTSSEAYKNFINNEQSDSDKE